MMLKSPHQSSDTIKEEEPICKNCYYYRISNTDYNKVCKRYPPSYNIFNDIIIFPPTAYNDWCGEYKNTN